MNKNKQVSYSKEENNPSAPNNIAWQYNVANMTKPKIPTHPSIF